LFRSPAVAGRVEDAARVDSPGDQLFHRPFDLDALPHAPGPEEEIQPVRLDVGQDVGSIDERRRGDASEVAVAACPVRVAPPEVRCRELLFDLAGLHGPAPRKSIPFRRTIRKKVYVFAVSSSRKYTFLPLTPRWGAHGRAAGATSSPANERCATPAAPSWRFPGPKWSRCGSRFRARGRSGILGPARRVKTDSFLRRAGAGIPCGG